ncbi:hypothetical protein [Lysobacter sp. CFH 32150]|uniref:hypothetical protein n=1 Tax=Lysobacter sp. CFH 32150 TaxID=2927128 RepID=UPI001FA7CB58|nr:hypothetical protein [Lysobacter sp. CFH 32150]MCI4566516.1 hypothetical protein [Lysobacter sp. CFH 32150]
MNTHDHDNDMPDTLRWSLRGLRREEQPQHDLWPAIAQRIATMPQVRNAPSQPAWRRFAPLATAAVLALAIGVVWQLRPVQQGAADPTSALLAQEADAMTREYQAALHELDSTAANKATPALRELDRSAAQIRTALTRAPDARFLLERLQRTYARRLALTQRLVLT